MIFGSKTGALRLFAGDIVVFVLSLWLTLLVRYGSVPSPDLFYLHLELFGVLFVLWSLVFYMAGLYSKRVLLSQYELTGAIVKTQLLNIVLAALFFSTVPGLAIAPKTNLVIYLGVSLGLILLWRLTGVPRLSVPSMREPAALIATGAEADALVAEVNGNKRYPFIFKEVIDPGQNPNPEAVVERLRHSGTCLLVVDTEGEKIEPLLPAVYKLAFEERRCRIADFSLVYEEVFDRVPLSVLQHGWFLKNLRRPPFGFYSFFKMTVDVAGGLLMAVVTALVTPFVYLALRVEGPGPLFLAQERFGRYGSRMKVYKFRSMTHHNAASSDWVGEERDNRVTRVGSFLRQTSLDEFPQFINILRGELSLVGPRNDIVGLGERLAREIPYYMARYMVKPGLTGWAQINQQYEQGNISPQSVAETRVRLAYDFYYIKNRSFALDILIALRTVKRMFFRVSSW
jgi:lipopolysaccharide/colanic/teichoic acid biosynthesis glycosyltransferase